MGVGGAAGRLIELGERQRRAQFEAARALLLRDGDGGQEGFLGGRGVGGIALQQDVAADAMQVGVESRDGRCGRTSPALRRGSRWRGRGRPARASSFGQRDLQVARRSTERSVRAAARRRDACPRARADRAARQPSPSPRETRRTRATWSDRARARGRASSSAFGAARAGSPRISSNMAAMQFPVARACRHGRGSTSARRRLHRSARARDRPRPAAIT